MTVVVHINSFSGKIEGGYLMIGGKKSGKSMPRAEVLAYLSNNPDARCDFLRT